MKTNERKKILLMGILIAILASGCGAGGKDTPFVFPPFGPTSEESPPPPSACTTNSDCEADEECRDGRCVTRGTRPCDSNEDCAENEVCQDGSCAPQTTGSCETDDGCETGEICKDNACVAGCRADTDCESGEFCDTASNICKVVLPAESCEVEFDSYLELRADAPSATSDIPPLCSDPAYLNPPHTDLICCTAANFDNPGTTPFGNPLECDVTDHLTITRYHAAGPMRLRFDLSGGGCRVLLAATDFPEYRLENSGLDASLIIDAGATSTDPRLREATAVSNCRETENGIEIDGLPLQFMVRLYENFTRCQLGFSSCEGTSSFSRWFFDLSSATSPPPPDTIQILPGLSNPPFLLTTGSDSESPAEGVSNVQPISTIGIPMRLDPATGQTVLQISAAWRMPNDSTADPDAGTGQLTGPLANAVMTAEIGGTVRNPNKADGTILSLADLAANCGTGGGGGGTALSLEASITVPDEELSQTLEVEGDADTGFTISACLPGLRVDETCSFLPSPALPFAKEVGDPFFPETFRRFEKDAVISLTIGNGSTATLDFDIPTEAGPFRVLNADLLNTVSIAPVADSQINLEMRFEPERAECREEAGEIRCDDFELVISQNPRIALRLSGKARIAAPLLRLDEISPVSPHTATTLLAPRVDSPPLLEFPERIVGVQAHSKLLRLSNEGVREALVDTLNAQDLEQNFRIGSVYQGECFSGCPHPRVWRGGQDQWAVPPDGEDDLFFFITYGPFARRPVTSCGGIANLRCDSSSLIVAAEGAAPVIVPMAGTAKREQRAIASLYIQDESRFTASGSVCGEGCVTVGSEHLYRAENLLFSFRQDGSARALYLRNDAEPGREDLRVPSQPELLVDGPNTGKFEIDWEDGEEGEENVTYPLLIGTGDEKKIAMIRFDVPEGDVDYRIFDATFLLRVSSGDGTGDRPLIGGGEPTAGSGPEVRFALKGANGAPEGLTDLIIHRLFSGMDFVLAGTVQRSRIASSTTRGILERYQSQQGLSSVDFGRYQESYRLADRLDLNPVTGQATLLPIFTLVDANFASPQSTGELGGIRLFFGPGSAPNATDYEYRIQCERDGGDCSYVYLYLASWEIVDQVPAGEGCVSGRPAISSAPVSDPNTRSLTNVLDPQPQNAGQVTCMRNFLEETAEARAVGTFDPVTGEISIPNLAVRLFAPSTDIVGDADSVLHLSLTTECITGEFVPDSSVGASRLVPPNTLNDTAFDSFLMVPPGATWTNPLQPYAGGGCADRELHGRRMQLTGSDGAILNGDTSGGYDGATVESLNLDLAGVGRMASSAAQGRGKMMYIIIKAEIVP